MQHVRWNDLSCYRIAAIAGCIFLALMSAPVPAQVVDLGTTTRLEQRSVARVSETEGELETAVSADGQNIVVAVNNRVSGEPFDRPTVFFSSDGGQTFGPSTLSGSAICSLRNRRDPTVARGGGGNFYYAALCGGGTTTGSVVGRSSDGGVTFQFLTDQATVCVPDDAAGGCNADQPHIAADPRTGRADEQIYLVWREIDRNPRRNADGDFVDGAGNVVTDVAEAVVSRPETQMIECSTDGGATWINKKPVAAGIISRVSTGPDGKVYVVWTSGRTGERSIFLQRFSDCASGLNPELLGTSDEPRHVVTTFQNVPCPVPGLDRCNDGNILSSPTLAVDQNRPNAVFVAYADRTAPGNEDIKVIGSLDGGETFILGPETISGNVVSRKYLPWSCGANGEVFVAWYDRKPATVQDTDLTQYTVRSFHLAQTVGSPRRTILRRSPEMDVTGGVPDSQCGSGWPVGPRNIADSENCSVQPQLAGICAPNPDCSGSAPRPAGCNCGRSSHCETGTTCSAGVCVDDSRLTGGAAPRCDFSNPNCNEGESCRIGRGAPKYGDYNGIACTGRSAFIAWASGTPPLGVSDALGFGVFHSRLLAIRSPRLDLCDRIPRLCTLNPDMGRSVLDLECRRPGCMVIDHIPDNCKRKFDCPGCEANGLCPPWYQFAMDGLDQGWDVSLVDGSGKRVPAKIRRSGQSVSLSFRPDKGSFSPGEIGDFHLVFKSKDGSAVLKKSRIKMNLKRLDKEPD